jgi:hypothetical protein
VLSVPRDTSTSPRHADASSRVDPVPPRLPAPADETAEPVNEAKTHSGNSLLPSSTLRVFPNARPVIQGDGLLPKTRLAKVTISDTGPDTRGYASDMMLTGVLFVLFLGGCWLYCLTDAVLTPAVAYRGLPKAAWVSIIAMTFILGALVWLAVRSRERPLLAYAGSMQWSAAEASLARHPAGRYRKASLHDPASAHGPDDDPDFLRHLDRIIRGTSN